MARRSNKCCLAAQQGLLNQPIRINVPGHGQRCAECTVITKRNGQPGFHFRFHKSQVCGIVSGCPALTQGTGTQQLALPGPQF